MKRPSLLTLAVTCCLTLPVLADKQGYPEPTDWSAEMALFAIEDQVKPAEAGAIVATGSSSMRFWRPRIAEDLAPLTIIPRGFGGSNMKDVWNHLDQLVLQYRPRALMVYEGDNDVFQGVHNDIIMDTYRQTFARLHSELPDLRIYVLSVKPSISRMNVWSQMADLNKRLADYCETDDRLSYIDVATPMFDDEGELPADLFISDMLHMNASGYEIWRDAVRKILIPAEAPHEEATQP